MDKTEVKPFKANNTIRLEIERHQIYLTWLEFIKPCYPLTDREAEVAASFLEQRDILRKIILDPEILIRTLHHEETTKTMRSRCKDMSASYFQIMKSRLKTKKFFTASGDIEPRLIPKVEEEGSTFKLLFLIKLKNELPGNTDTGGE